MKSANNRFTKYAVSAFLAVAAWPSLAFIPTYPPIERAVATIRPSGAADRFGYDGLGNMAAYTNAEGNVYTLVSDALGRVTAATNALGLRVFNAGFDGAGNVAWSTDGRGKTVTNTHDPMDNLIQRMVKTGTIGTIMEEFSTFTYDAARNLLTASNAIAHEAFTYDVMDRVAAASTAVDGHAFTNRWSRDRGGLVTNITYAAGKSVSRAFDQDGRLTSVTDWLGHTWTFAYDGAGKPVSSASPGGIHSANSYDGAGRLASWSVGSIAGRSITRDVAGQRIRDDITAGPVPVPARPRQADNTFDAADRLVSASVRYGTNAPVAETYAHDLNGAVTNIMSGSASAFSAAYNALGQLFVIYRPLSTELYSYDAIGNRVCVGDRIIVPDHADPMKRPLMECDAVTGAVIRHYIWGPGRLLGFTGADGTLTVAHCDEYGSVIALTSENGAVLHTALYGPHGEDWGTTGTNPTPFAWLGGHGVRRVGGEYGLYLTTHRLYSATLNRFLSPDPLGIAGGLNLYQYAEGNPLAYIDPLGLCAYPGGVNYDAALAKGVDAVWNFGVQFLSYNPNFTPSVQDAVYQANLGYFGSPLMRLGMYGDASSSPMMIPSEMISSAWEAGAASTALRNVGANHPPANVPMTTALSPYRYTTAGETFYHYGYAEQASSLAKGLHANSFVTSVNGLSGIQARQGLALPSIGRPLPNTVYTISPPTGTAISVNPIAQPLFGQPGGLPEVKFLFGTPPGSVGLPVPIPLR